MIRVSDLAAKVVEVGEANPYTSYPERYTDITGESCDYKDTCRYQVDGQPACIVGVALHELGVSIETLEMFDHSPDSSIYQLMRDYSGVYFELDDEDAQDFVSLAQEDQDMGDRKWGSVIAL